MSRMNEAEYARILRYGVGGVSTTLVNIILFRLLDYLLPGYRLANLIAIVLSKVYGFFVNKLFVFRSRRLSASQQIREIFSFVAARGFTGVVDYFGLILLVSLIGMEPFPAKVIVQGIVIVLNYILGKFFVFSPRTDRPQAPEGDAADEPGK